MKRKSHRNNLSRLTLPERLDRMARDLLDAGYPASATEIEGGIHGGEIRKIIARHVQAHARQALARERARREGAR